MFIPSNFKLTMTSIPMTYFGAHVAPFPNNLRIQCENSISQQI